MANNRETIEKEAWKSFFQWFIAIGITVFLFWEVTLHMLVSSSSPVLVYPFYALVMIVSFFFFGNIIGALVVAFLATLLGVFAFSFLNPYESAVVFFQACLFWSLIWGIIRFMNRREKTFQRDKMLVSDLEDNFNEMKLEHEKDLMKLESLKERIGTYRKLSQVTRQLSSTLDFKQVSYRITTLTRDLIGKGDVRFLSKGENLNCFERWVLEKHSSLLVTNLKEDYRFEAREYPSRIRSLIAAPLKQEGKVSAILSVESDRENFFTEDDLRLLSIMADLSSIAWQNAHLFRKMQKLAITDGLTGLYLKGFFNERLEEEILRTARFSSNLSLIMIDIDFFKEKNDSYGHQAGDIILSELAGIFRENVRETDLVSRYGGEEFAILMPRTAYDDAYFCADKIRTKVEKKRFDIGDKKIKLTVSIGVASFGPGMNLAGLVSAADKALYQAKAAGRNNVK